MTSDEFRARRNVQIEHVSRKKILPSIGSGGIAEMCDICESYITGIPCVRFETGDGVAGRMNAALCVPCIELLAKTAGIS